MPEYAKNIQYLMNIIYLLTSVFKKKKKDCLYSLLTDTSVYGHLELVPALLYFHFWLSI